MSLGKLFKKALPAVAGAFLGPAAGAALFPGATGIMASPFLQRALTSGAVGLLTGQKPKDAILSGIMGGVGGQFLGGDQAAMQQGIGGTGLPIGPSGQVSFDQIAKKAVQDAAKTSASAPGGAGFGALKGAAKAADAKTMSGDLLKSLGFAGEDEGNLLFKILNSQLGEGLAAGLVAQLLAGDDDEEVVGEFERRPFGAGGPGGKIGSINYAEGGEATKPKRQPTIMDIINKFKTIETPFGSGVTRDQRLELLKRLGMVQTAAKGGEMSFPRRNGGIDPAEGSGTKDDVPAMLMAGEFVMTRDAVKGMGDGNLRKGIDRMYGMMDNLERMA